mmetsp:Transcript_14266/g.32379  ORF Transcript_14266/g.32379 Transcript_14266/m.32379 type:complete len:255 (+) Transcript_14266:3-767(+)
MDRNVRPLPGLLPAAATAPRPPGPHMNCSARGSELLAALVVLLGRAVEGDGGLGKVIALLHEGVQALASLEEVIHGLHHHALDLVQLLLDLRELVRLGRVVELCEERLDLRARQGCVLREILPLAGHAVEENAHRLRQERERNPGWILAVDEDAGADALWVHPGMALAKVLVEVDGRPLSDRCPADNQAAVEFDVLPERRPLEEGGPGELLTGKHLDRVVLLPLVQVQRNKPHGSLLALVSGPGRLGVGGAERS